MERMTCSLRLLHVNGFSLSRSTLLAKSMGELRRPLPIEAGLRGQLIRARPMSTIDRGTSFTGSVWDALWAKPPNPLADRAKQWQFGADLSLSWTGKLVKVKSIEALEATIAARQPSILALSTRAGVCAIGSLSSPGNTCCSSAFQQPIRALVFGSCVAALMPSRNRF
jgi:hypothetical protein